MTDREKLIALQKEAVRNCDPGTTCLGSRYRTEADCMERVVADHLLANGVTIQRWIPVEERLPEVRVPVLTYGRKGAVGIGFTQPTSVTADGKIYFYARYGDHLPTHWMPLPQPPKEVE